MSSYYQTQDQGTIILEMEKYEDYRDQIKSDSLYKLWQDLSNVMKDPFFAVPLLMDDLITGIDLGRKIENGQVQKDKFAIRLHVRRKLNQTADDINEAMLALIKRSFTDNFRPLKITLGTDPANYYDSLIKRIASDSPTEVIGMKPRNRNRARRPMAACVNTSTIQPGISIGHKNRSGGTLGAIVFRKGDDRPMILSCWHVLATPGTKPGARVLHPARTDGGDLEGGLIAHYEDGFVSELGDAAVASLLPADILARPVYRYQLGTNDGKMNPIVLDGCETITPQDLGREVEKSGKTSGVTKGIIDGIGYYFIKHQHQRIPVMGFKIVPDPNHTEPGAEISAPGDSGAVWYLTGTTKGVGLHFEGEKDNSLSSEYGLACHLKPVLEKLNVSLEPQKAHRHFTSFSRG